MLERTSTEWAPWTLVEADSKRYARVKVLETVIEATEEGLRAARAQAAALASVGFLAVGLAGLLLRAGLRPRLRLGLAVVLVLVGGGPPSRNRSTSSRSSAVRLERASREIQNPIPRRTTSSPPPITNSVVRPTSPSEESSTGSTVGAGVGWAGGSWPSNGLSCASSGGGRQQGEGDDGGGEEAHDGAQGTTTGREHR